MPASTRPFAFAAPLLLAAALAACDGAVDPAAGEPNGLRISLNGAMLVRVDGGQVSGSLHTHVAEYSGRFVIAPVTSGGQMLAETGHTLEAVVTDPAVASFVPTAAGAFEGEIVSHAEGTTTITFRVVPTAVSSDDGYEAPPILLVAVQCGPSGSSTSAASCASSARRW
jgi:hypothetical protein